MPSGKMFCYIILSDKVERRESVNICQIYCSFEFRNILLKIRLDVIGIFL